MHLREALLDAGEDVLEPADVEVGGEAALHHDRGAAEVERLLDLAMDLCRREQVTLTAPRALVEGAEAAARDAVVGVVDIAVDDEGDLAPGVQAATYLVGAEAELEQVAAFEEVESLGIAETRGRRARAGRAARRHPRMAHSAASLRSIENTT